MTKRSYTGEMRLSTLEDVYEVSYYYDADGNMMESVVRAQTGDLMSIQWTIYVNKHFERQVDWVVDTSIPEVVESHYYYRLYYYAGDMRIAEDYYQNGVPTHYPLVTDHLNSQSLMVANTDGTVYNEMRYTAFGEIRASSGLTPTEFRYTGQLRQAELGLYYYVARWYDPEIAHFVQADTIVPKTSVVASFDRYAYVNFNPIVYKDPTGHRLTVEDSMFDGKSKASNPYVRTFAYYPFIRDRELLEFKNALNPQVRLAYESQSSSPKVFSAKIFKGEFSGLTNRPEEVKDIIKTAATNWFNSWRSSSVNQSGKLWADVANWLYAAMESSKGAVDNLIRGYDDHTRPKAQDYAIDILETITSSENLNDPHVYVNEAMYWANESYYDSHPEFNGRSPREEGIVFQIIALDTFYVITGVEDHWIKTGVEHEYKNK
jgi:RHS repeat-associated protein